MKRSSLFLMAVAVGCGLTARAEYATCTWANSTGNNTPMTAFDWTDADNWQNQTPPAKYDRADFPNFSGQNASYYVRMPDDVTLGYLSSGGRAICIGEKFTLSSVALGTTPRIEGPVWLYADLYPKESAGDSTSWLSGNIMVAGRIISPFGYVVPAGSTTALRMDKYATHGEPLRTDDLQIPDEYALFPGNASFSAYVAGGSSLTAAWKQEAGSPFVDLVSGTSTNIAVGAAVTGQGIPEGTFVRRRFPNDSSIELSAPATETIASNILTIDEFHPDARIRIKRFLRQGTDGSNVKLYRWREQDRLSLEADDFNSNSKAFWIHGLTDDEAKSWKSGTLVLHDIGAGSGVPIADRLRNCHLLLAGGVADPTTTTFPASRPMGFESAASTARLTVTNGITGVVTVFTNFTGTLVKDGAGTLRLGIADAANAGTISIEAGRLELSSLATAGTSGLTFKGLTMAAGAELLLPPEGMTVASASLVDGAVVRGPGVLTIKGPKTANVTALEGALIVYSYSDADNYVVNPVAQVAGHPAFWVDASKPETMEYVEEGDAYYVTRWNDCRAGEPMFCTNVVKRPRLYAGEAMKDKYVHIRHEDTVWYTNTQGLVWSQPIDHIRAVFMVHDPSEGGGEILGRTSRLPNSYYGTQGGPYYRTNGDWHRQIVHPDFATPSVKFGRFFLNGEEVVGYQKGYLSAGIQLTEHHINTNYVANAGHPELCCDAFGTGGYLDGHQYNNANGYQRLSEVLVYTNSLTHAERVQTALYLSRKWLGKDIVYTDVDVSGQMGSVGLGAGESIRVEERATVGVDVLADGSSFVKEGDGRMVVNAVNAGDVVVKGGELVLKSLSTNNAAATGGAWVHVDAAAAETVTADADGKVSKWTSVAGDGQYYAPLSGTGKLVANSLNGLPMIDCGTRDGDGKAAYILKQADGTGYTHSNADNYITGVPFYKTVFAVYGSKGGGNSILGNYGNGYPWQGLAFRYVSSFPQPQPMFTANTHESQSATTGAWSYDAFQEAHRQVISNGVARLNGADFDPFETSFSGKYDLLTLRIDNNVRKSDTLCTYGQGANQVGGLEYGEVLIYDRQLTDVELLRTEAYLRKKWFNAESPTARTPYCASLSVADGARVNVADWLAGQGDARYGDGNGDIVVGALGGDGEIAASCVKLAENGRLKMAVGEPIGLTVTGALELPTNAVVEITGNLMDLECGLYPLLSCASVTGAQTR